MSIDDIVVCTPNEPRNWDEKSNMFPVQETFPELDSILVCIVSLPEIVLGKEKYSTLDRLESKNLMLKNRLTYHKITLVRIL